MIGTATVFGAAVPATDELDIVPPFLGRRGGLNPAYGPVRGAGGVGPGSQVGYEVYVSPMGPGYPVEVPIGGAGMAPGRAPGVLVFPGDAPTTVAGTWEGAVYTARLKSRGELYVRSVMIFCWGYHGVDRGGTNGRAGSLFCLLVAPYCPTIQVFPGGDVTLRMFICLYRAVNDA